MKSKFFWRSFFVVFSAIFFLANPGNAQATSVSVTGKAKVLNTNNSYLDFTNYNSNVLIDNANGNFAGYAFLEDMGWVAFGTTDNSLGPVSVNLTSGAVTGKAKVLNSGAYLDFTNYNSNVTANITTGVFSGYVFSEDVGWLNFGDTGVSALTTLDTVAPLSFDLDSPGDNSYTNSERPTFKWKATTDASSGLSKYVLEIDNPSIGSSQPSGDFTIDSIPTSRTTDYETSKYIIHYENFSDSDTTNNYISVYTKSHSDWGTNENDGKLREGRVSWKVKAVDNAGNERSSSRTLFVDGTNPKAEFTQINSTPFTSSNFSTTDKTPTIFGKITDPLAGGDSSQTQDENGPKKASGPKEVNIKVEKKEGLTYKLITLYKINMDNPYYTCDSGKTIDNSKQKCDKYLPFEYTPNESLDLGTYKITVSGKDKADNTSPETSFTLNITTLAQITTPEEKETIEEGIKELPQEEQEKVKEELEITKPQEPSALEKTVEKVSTAGKSAFNSLISFVGNVISGVGHGIQVAFNTLGQGVKLALNITGEALAFIGQKTGEGVTFISQGINNTTKLIGDRYNYLANNAPGVAKTILIGLRNGVSIIASTSVTIAYITATTIGNITNFVVKTNTDISNATRNGIASLAFTIGEKTENLSHGVGTAIIRIGYIFVPEPTKISNVTAVVLAPTSVKITWETNHPANGKVNWGYSDGIYEFEQQSDKRTGQHEFILENLKPDTEYHYEVMSQNRNYVYDANRKFKTPAK